MTSIILTTICALALNSVPLSAPADTIIAYAIDGQKVERFDGSQLIGKKIASYEIIKLDAMEGPTILHSILTEEGAKNSRPVTVSFRKVDTTDVVFVVDGTPVSEEEFQQLDAKRISSMDIIKDSSAEELLRKLKEEGKYKGEAEGHGVILVRTKDSK